MRATREKGKKSGRKNEKSEGVCWCGGTVAKPNTFLSIHVITAGPARINSCLWVKEIQREVRKKREKTGREGGRERDTTCRRTQPAKYHSSHYRKFMVAETAAQFNSPLWQIENYSLVPPAGAINCVRQRWAASVGPPAAGVGPHRRSAWKVSSLQQNFVMQLEVKLVTAGVITTTTCSFLNHSISTTVSL